MFFKGADVTIIITHATLPSFSIARVSCYFIPESRRSEEDSAQLTGRPACVNASQDAGKGLDEFGAICDMIFQNC